MKFGYTIVYVPNVQETLTFFQEIFGFSIRFVQEDDYGELNTGDTTLAFASHTMGKANLPQGYVEADSSEKPLGMEIALVTDAVEEAHNKAVTGGAISLQAPKLKPWGQTVSYIKCPGGVLVELCSPMPK